MSHQKPSALGVDGGPSRADRDEAADTETDRVARAESLMPNGGVNSEYDEDDEEPAGKDIHLSVSDAFGIDEKNLHQPKTGNEELDDAVRSLDRRRA